MSKGRLKGHSRLGLSMRLKIKVFWRVNGGKYVNERNFAESRPTLCVLERDGAYYRCARGYMTLQAVLYRYTFWCEFLSVSANSRMHFAIDDDAVQDGGRFDKTRVQNCRGRKIIKLWTNRAGIALKTMEKGFWRLQSLLQIGWVWNRVLLATVTPKIAGKFESIINTCGKVERKYGI